MNPEVIEVPRTLVPTLIAVFNKVLLYGQDLNYSKKIDGISTTMTRSFSPNAFYYQDSRRVTLEKGIYRYEHSVEIQKSASKESCNMYYLLYLSGRVISNIVSSGTNSQPQIISLSPNFRSPYEFFGDFGFLQRPAPDDTRNRRLF